MNSVASAPKSGAFPVKKNKDSSVQHQDKLVINAVIASLGKPKNLHHATATNVFNNRWRVNLWCSHDKQLDVSVTSVLLIDYSYFITWDNESNDIISSDPEIQRLKDKDTYKRRTF